MPYLESLEALVLHPMKHINTTRLSDHGIVSAVLF